MKDFLFWYFALWIITFPITILSAYILLTEFLDLILNTKKINNLLKHSDIFNPEPLEEQHDNENKRQSILSQSLLLELDRQMKYIRQIKSKSSPNTMTTKDEMEKIISAKELSDIFKIR
jgi:hypothetical protein